MEKIAVAISIRLAYWLTKLICALISAAISIAITVLGIGVFIWIYTTSQPVWISGPSALAGGLILLISFWYSESSLSDVPEKWENFFLRAID